MFELRSAEADGPVMVATLGLRDARPANVWQMVYVRDLLTVHA